MDVDGDGNVDDAELEEFAKKFIKEKKSGAQKKTYLYWALAGLAVLAISNIGTAFLAFSAAKDLKVVGGVLTNAKNGNIAKVNAINGAAVSGEEEDSEAITSGRHLADIEVTDGDKKICRKGMFQLKRVSSFHDDRNARQSEEHRRSVKRSGLTKHTHYLVGPTVMKKSFDRYAAKLGKKKNSLVVFSQECRTSQKYREDSWNNRKKKDKRERDPDDDDASGWNYNTPDDYDDDYSDDGSSYYDEDWNKYSWHDSVPRKTKQHAAFKYQSVRTDRWRNGQGMLVTAYVYKAKSPSGSNKQDVADALLVTCVEEKNKRDKSMCSVNWYIKQKEQERRFDTDGKDLYTWRDAEEYCDDKGMKLLKIDELCPEGNHRHENRDFLVEGDGRNNWVAVYDKDNWWMNLKATKNDYCDIKKNPNWGNDMNTNVQKNNHVFCKPNRNEYWS